MCLVRGNYRHSLHALANAIFISNSNAIVVLWDDLLIIRVRPFNQTGEDRCKRRPESNMVISPCNLELFLGGKETPYLLKRFRRNDQITGRALAESWAFPFSPIDDRLWHHPHLIWPQFQRTPFRIGRLSSADTAKEVCEISCCKSPDRIRQLSLKPH